MYEYEQTILNAILNSNDPNRAVQLFAIIVEKIAAGETIELQSLSSLWVANGA